MSCSAAAEKVVGIIGGMGPEATVDLMQRIIRLTPATDDIDHIRCIVDNNPKVPSRIKAIIEGTGENPGPCMAEMGKKLETWGADFLAIPCNTAHAYHDYVRKAVKIPVLHLIDLTVKHVLEAFPNACKVGVLASPAVHMTGLYIKRFESYGVETVQPEADYQEQLFKLIRRIKTGDTGSEVIKQVQQICMHLKSLGAEPAIVACTELSVLDIAKSPINLVDASELLAQEIVDIAKNSKQLVKEG